VNFPVDEIFSGKKEVICLGRYSGVFMGEKNT
jgi:hypothetical protein